MSLFRKRWEVWVHYRLGDEIIKSRLLKRHRFLWWAKQCHEGVVHNPAVLLAIMESLDDDGRMIFPELEYRRT